MSAAALIRLGNTSEVLRDCPSGSFEISRLAAPTKKLSLVIPTFNEGENIERFLNHVCSVLDRKLGDGYEVIVVDDDSPDNTRPRKHPRFG
jgi:cellulose synthase/poly-beta-1,6-N-acetylglucosamine synthase-like glycosyltransferase